MHGMFWHAWYVLEYTMELVWSGNVNLAIPDAK